MARSKSSGSNIYSQHNHREALDIADRSMRNEFVNPADSIGIVPDKLRTEMPDVEFKHLTTNTGKPDKSAGHDNLPVDSAVKSVTNPRQSHEKVPVDFGAKDVHTDAYKDHP